MGNIPEQYDTALRRYLDPLVIARNVEAEWADLLIDGGIRVPEDDELFKFGTLTTEFYINAIAWFATHCQKPMRILEVGSAAGRTTWELAKRFRDAEEICGVDTSPLFVDLARAIVGPGPAPRVLPIPSGSLDGFEEIDIGSALAPVAAAIDRSKVTFLHSAGEDVPWPKGSMDAVVCLNVVDRHPQPRILCQRITDLVGVGGTVLITSPHDWQDKYTLPENSIRDLRDIFDDGCWTIRGVREFDYALRMNPRLIWHFKSQAVIARRISDA